MLAFLTIFIMAGVGYAYLREGLLTAFAMLCNVLLAGFVTFNFWGLWRIFSAGLFRDVPGGYEDFICMIGLFAITLGALRHRNRYFRQRARAVSALRFNGRAASWSACSLDI